MKSAPFIGFIAILLLLLASCDGNNNLPDNERSDGQLIPIRIHSLGMAEGSLENFTRSASPTPEAAIIPLGDGMLMETSIEQNPSPLRGLVNLKTGAHFRVIAVETATNKIYTYGDFVYGGSNSIPTFYVHVGDEYYFVCISHNDETNFDASSAYSKGSTLPSFAVSNTKDMLWWKSSSRTITSDADIMLDIKLEQKLVKINVIIDCTYNERKITNISTSRISLGAINTSGSLDLTSGVVSASGSTSNPYLTWSTLEAPYPSEHSANELTVMPKASGNINITIRAHAISREGLLAIPTRSNITARFLTALSSGSEYTLRIKLRTPKLAASNIYWEWYDDEDGNLATHTAGGHLKFVPYQKNGSRPIQEGYQGVCFKYGSLVGISPINNSSVSVAAYVPNGDAWDATTISTYAQISAWGDSGTPSYGIFEINATYPNVLQGDICSHINSAYRLPKFREFGTENTIWANNPDGWVKDGNYTAITTTLTDGTFNVITNGRGYATNACMDGGRLPTTGFIYDTGLLSATLGAGGYYRTNGESTDANAQYLKFDNLDFYAINYISRHAAFPVRCIMND